MRDPMSWALPVFRAYGIPVKVHLFFFVITLGLFFRQVMAKGNPITWTDVFLFTIPLLFFIILLHEFGHCFAARRVDGEAREILIWPLGGLASVEVPNTWKANFYTVAAGPFTNLLICVGLGGVMLAGGFVPSFNPVANPYIAEVHNYRDGRDYTSTYGLKLYHSGTAQPLDVQKDIDKFLKDDGLRQRSTFSPGQAQELANRYTAVGERALAPGWIVWAQRAFYLSWVLLLFNLLPAYPLDGGQMMMCLVWARTSQRQGTVVAGYSGLAIGLIFVIVSIAANEVLFALLGVFMLQMSWLKLNAPEVEDGPFGYDFSAGYTSLERDDDPRPRRKKRPGLVTRWWVARKMRRLQQEHEQRQRDEERMDQLLDKIARTGKDSLTDEERRFLERASSRYRNRS